MSVLVSRLVFICHFIYISQPPVQAVSILLSFIPVCVYSRPSISVAFISYFSSQKKYILNHQNICRRKRNVKFDISSVAYELCNSEQLTSPFWASILLLMDFVFLMLLELLNPETSLLSLWIDLKGSCTDSGLTGANYSLCPSELLDSPCLVKR